MGIIKITRSKDNKILEQVEFDTSVKELKSNDESQAPKQKKQPRKPRKKKD